MQYQQSAQQSRITWQLGKLHLLRNIVWYNHNCCDYLVSIWIYWHFKCAQYWHSFIFIGMDYSVVLVGSSNMFPSRSHQMSSSKWRLISLIQFRNVREDIFGWLCQTFLKLCSANLDSVFFKSWLLPWWPVKCNSIIVKIDGTIWEMVGSD